MIATKMPGMHECISPRQRTWARDSHLEPSAAVRHWYLKRRRTRNRTRAEGKQRACSCARSLPPDGVGWMDHGRGRHNDCAETLPHRTRRANPLRTPLVREERTQQRTCNCSGLTLGNLYRVHWDPGRIREVTFAPPAPPRARELRVTQDNGHRSALALSCRQPCTVEAGNF